MNLCQKALFKFVVINNYPTPLSFMLWHMLDFCLKGIVCVLENRSSIKLG